MMRWASRLVFAANIVFLAILMIKFGWHGLEAPNSEWEYKDLVTVLLTAVAVLLAVATVFVAGLAIWGYAAIREAAQARAEEIAKIIAADVAQAVAARETPGAVRVYMAASGVGAQPSSGADDADALTKALQTGDGSEGGDHGSES